MSPFHNNGMGGKVVGSRPSSACITYQMKKEKEKEKRGDLLDFQAGCFLLELNYCFAGCCVGSLFDCICMSEVYTTGVLIHGILSGCYILEREVKHWDSSGNFFSLSRSAICTIFTFFVYAFFFSCDLLLTFSLHHNTDMLYLLLFRFL